MENSSSRNLTDFGKVNFIIQKERSQGPLISHASKIEFNLSDQDLLILEKQESAKTDFIMLNKMRAMAAAEPHKTTTTQTLSFRLRKTQDCFHRLQALHLKQKIEKNQKWAQFKKDRSKVVNDYIEVRR